MPIIRATFFFTDQRGAGWTETFHNNLTTLQGVMTRAKALVPLRVVLMGMTSNLQFVRVSDDLIKRDSIIFRVPANNQVGKSAVWTFSDPANTSLPLRIDANPVRRKTCYLRGLPDALVTDSGFFNANADWLGVWAPYRAELITGTWAVKGKKGTAPTFQVSSATQDLTTGKVTVNTVGVHGYLPGNVVNISGAKGAPQLNGSWTIAGVPSNTSFTIYMNQILGAYTQGGIVQLNEYDLAAITDVSFPPVVSERKAGRPFTSPRGRRKARVRR